MVQFGMQTLQPLRARVQYAVHHRLELALDRRDRRSQVVRDVLHPLTAEPSFTLKTTLECFRGSRYKREFPRTGFRERYVVVAAADGDNARSEFLGFARERGGEHERYCERETNRDKYADGDCVAHGFHELTVRLVCEEVRAVNGKIGYNGRAILDRERRIPVEQRLRRSSLRLEVLRADASAFLYEKNWPLVLVEDVHEEGVGHVGKERRFERGFREASVQAVCLRNHRDENRLKVFLLFPVPVHDGCLDGEAGHERHDDEHDQRGRKETGKDFSENAFGQIILVVNHCGSALRRSGIRIRGRFLSRLMSRVSPGGSRYGYRLCVPSLQKNS